MTGNQTRAKRSFRFSVIDFVIVLLILAGIVGVAVRFDLIDRLFSKTSQVDAEITVIAEAITPAQAEALKEGTVVYYEGERFGALKTVSTETALIYVENQEGKLVSYEDDDLLDLSGVLLCSLLPTDDGYLLNGNRHIAAGSTFLLQANGVAVKVTVLGIEETAN